MSQEQLAERLGLAKATVGMYERGERMPSFEVMIKISRVFGVSVDYLLGLQSAQPTTLDVSTLTPDQVQAVFLVIDEFKRANR